MTDPDDRLRRLYGSLPREEPPPALDAAVLAAARRAVARPSLARRWGAPISIAAVLVLVVGVTLEMQREQPGIETSVAPSYPPADNAPGAAPAAVPEAALPAKPAEAPRAQRALKAKALPQRARPEPAPEAKRGASPAADALEAAPVARAPAPAAAPSAAPAASANLSGEKRAAEAPMADLERIARLRAEGKDAQADRALEEFRRRHPGYRIEDAMWERVKPR